MSWVEMIWAKRAILVALTGAAMTTAAMGADTTIRVGMVRAVSSGALLIAVERGYFKQLGLDVAVEEVDSSANALALLSQNRFQVVMGGLSAGYFNAMEKGLPIIIAISRVSTPIRHKLLLRADLVDRVKEIGQLKGKTIATNGPGSVSTYEIGKILESAGLTLADVDLRVIPFGQYAIAFTNKAIDAALAISPWSVQLPKQGLAMPFADSDELIRPSPVSISVASINTDWAKATPDRPRDFFLGYQRGARDYCQAYHGGSPRRQIVDLLVRSGTETRPELLDEYVWPSSDPYGRINIGSMLDMQAWFARHKFTGAQMSAERLVDASYAEYAAQKLGPFVLENKASPLAGCR
jgi:NitT/TauT family transport system substrate-binding protein